MRSNLITLLQSLPAKGKNYKLLPIYPREILNPTIPRLAYLQIFKVDFWQPCHSNANIKATYHTPTGKQGRMKLTDEEIFIPEYKVIGDSETEHSICAKQVIEYFVEKEKKEKHYSSV